jgi:hypothetical protein
MSESIRTTSKNGVQLDFYKGEYSLSSTREGNDGKFRPQYALYQAGRDKYQEKAWPVKVGLGDKTIAAAVLRTILKQLEGSHGDVPESDVPF